MRRVQKAFIYLLLFPLIYTIIFMFLLFRFVGIKWFMKKRYTLQQKKWIYNERRIFRALFYPSEVNFTRSMSTHQREIPCLTGGEGGIGWKEEKKEEQLEKERSDINNYFIFWIKWISNFLLLLSSYPFETYMGLVQFSLSLVIAE